MIDGYTRNGRLGGHQPFGDKHNGWNFVTAGTARDATPVEELFVELNRAGFSGGVSIEWEDNDVEQHAGAKPPWRMSTAPTSRRAQCATTSN